MNTHVKMNKHPHLHYYILHNIVSYLFVCVCVYCCILFILFIVCFLFLFFLHLTSVYVLKFADDYSFPSYCLQVISGSFSIKAF